MTKPDFPSMLEMAIASEQMLRSLLKGLDGKVLAAGQVVSLIAAHNESIDTILSLKFYLNEHADGDEETDFSSPTSSLRDIIDGEAAEMTWEQMVKDMPWLENPPPDGVV